MGMPEKFCCLVCDRTRDEHAAITSHEFVAFEKPPQPPLPAAPHIKSIIVRRNAGVWHATVSDGAGAKPHGKSRMGYGQAATWLDAVNAAIEDLTNRRTS